MTESKATYKGESTPDKPTIPKNPEPIPEMAMFQGFPAVEPRQPGYQAGLVLGYLKRSGKLDLDIKIGALAKILSLSPSEVSAALDELKDCGVLDMAPTSASGVVTNPSAWIPVSEKLPPPWHGVLGHIVRGGLVIDDDAMIDIVSWTGHVWTQWLGEDNDAPVTITHWMELPDAPKVAAQ